MALFPVHRLIKTLAGSPLGSHNGCWARRTRTARPCRAAAARGKISFSFPDFPSFFFVCSFVRLFSSRPWPASRISVGFIFLFDSYFYCVVVPRLVYLQILSAKLVLFLDHS